MTSRPSGDVFPLADAGVLVEVEFSVASVAADAEVEHVADGRVLVGKDPVEARALDARRRRRLCSKMDGYIHAVRPSAFFLFSESNSSVTKKDVLLSFKQSLSQLLSTVQ